MCVLCIMGVCCVGLFYNCMSRECCMSVVPVACGGMCVCSVCTTSVLVLHCVCGLLVCKKKLSV